MTIHSVLSNGMVRQMVCAFVATTAVLSLASCTRNPAETGYVVVRRQWVDTPDGTALDFTLKHGEAKYQGRCDTWDVKNHCGNMEVGNSYNLKLDEKSGVLKSKDTLNGRPSILLIPRERAN